LRISLCCFGYIMGCSKGTSSRMEKQQGHSLGYPWYRIFSKNSPPIHAFQHLTTSCVCPIHAW
jgi:hypothetical protein